jgi:threonine aldolase
LPLEYLAEARGLVEKYGLGLHLDGARLFNASVKLDVPVTEISRHFDSVSVCLSKGLCAPVGSLLCGTNEIVDKARRWRKMLGGGMRQAGVLAAAGILALTEQVQHLGRDHDNASRLARELGDLPGLDVDQNAVETNMVFVKAPEASTHTLIQKMADEGILIQSERDVIRLVTHFDFKEQQIERVRQTFAQALSSVN